MKTNISYLIFILLLFIGTPGWGQINLVQNPSFEQFGMCPSTWDAIKYANGWMSLDTLWTLDSTYIGYGIPDFCNLCAGSSLYTGLPSNGYFNQYPHSGNGVAQVNVFYNESDILTSQKRDYLQGHLLSNLILGQSYCVSFYVFLEQSSNFAINHIGAYLDNGSIDTTAHPGWPQPMVSPQVIETSIISDTANWVRISGSFVATGNENYITIGNFLDKNHTSFSPYPGTDSTGSYAFYEYSWYLVDDISVFRSDAIANIGPHTHSLSTTATDSLVLGDTLDTYLPTDWYANGVKIDSNKAWIKVLPRHNTTYKLALNKCGGAISWDSTYVTVGAGESLGASKASLSATVVMAPNPAQNILNITNAAGAAFAVYDLTGREVLSQKISTNQQAIDISGIEIGVYMIVLTDAQTGEKVVRRVVKE